MAKFRASTDPKFYLGVAKRHLKRVQDAWSIPDWGNLGTYGLYCLEALVRAAALKSGETPIRTHYGKADQSHNLAVKHKLPEIEELLEDLNIIRKADAYGDVEMNESDYDPGDIATKIEQYFDKVTKFVEQ